jgi:glycosyltransferase involved in cell wall biosynthesis
MGRPIVHVVQHLVPGGLEVMVLELARAQARHHEVMVVSLEGDRASAQGHWPRLAHEATRIVYLGKKPGVDLAVVWRLARLLRAEGAIGVHTHHIGPLLYAGLAARLHRNLRHIHTEHDAWHLQNAKRRRLAQIAMRIARPVLVADAPHVADAVVAALGGARPQVVLNGVDLDHFAPGDRAAARAVLGLPAGKPVIAIAARLEPVKGIDVALRALAEVPEAVLAIAGSGAERGHLEALSRDLGIAHRVIWLGHVDDTALLYQAADVVCLPSRAEGLPLALLEAQACGRMVVASRVGGVPGGIDPHSGILVEPEVPTALARGLLAALARGLQMALCKAVDGPGAADPRDFVMRTASLDTMEAAYTNLMLGAR